MIRVKFANVLQIHTYTCIFVSGASPPREMGVFIGESVALTCFVDEKLCGQLHSVKWYKNSTRIYVMRSVAKSKRDLTNRYVFKVIIFYK